MSENLISILVLGIVCLILLAFCGYLIKVENKRYEENMKLKREFLGVLANISNSIRDISNSYEESVLDNGK